MEKLCSQCMYHKTNQKYSFGLLTDDSCFKNKLKSKEKITISDINKVRVQTCFSPECNNYNNSYCNSFFKITGNYLIILLNSRLKKEFTKNGISSTIALSPGSILVVNLSLDEKDLSSMSEDDYISEFRIKICSFDLDEFLINCVSEYTGQKWRKSITPKYYEIVYYVISREKKLKILDNSFLEKIPELNLDYIELVPPEESDMISKLPIDKLRSLISDN